MSSLSLPVPSLEGENSLSQYLRAIKAFPMLDADEEYMLGKRWQEDGDRDAAHRLVTSHLRLVAKIAGGYRGYGLPMADLIAEGNLGLMQAVRKFDPERGFRLATYAMWWIKAAIQEYVLHSWSLVKIGTTAIQKKLFFNLRKLRNRLQALDNGTLTDDMAASIAKTLDVAPSEVKNMAQRLVAPDSSLNARFSVDSEGEWQDFLVDSRDNQETTLSNSQETHQRSAQLRSALATLNPREQQILVARRLVEPSITLEDLAGKFGISRERVRQIEARAMEKLTAFLTASAIAA